jgi:hypothetical protein
MRHWPIALLCAAGVAACGSRTGLLVPEDDETSPPGDDDDGTGPGGPDSGTVDDRGEPIGDALPPLDVQKPPPTMPNNCAEAGITYIYVVTDSFELMRFYPPTAEFTSIGALSCPSSGSNPFSMAVDETGIAYVLYQDGELFRVSTATASCRATSFASGQRGFSPTFGMGFSRDTTDANETLFVSGDTTSPQLATINPTSFALRVVGNLNPSIPAAELTGTGAGDLFAFYSTNGATPCNNQDPNATCTDSAIGQINKTTGQVTNQTVLFGRPQGHAWAFAFWGGDFYTFTAPNGGGTVVTRFDPSDGSATVVATRTDVIVGAGVSTCAPAQ